MMTPDPLGLPLGAIARPFEPLHPEDSLTRAAHLLRSTLAGILPVVGEDGRLQGVISQRGLLRALAEGASEMAPVADHLEPAPTLSVGALGATALRQFDAESQSVYVVVDSDSRPVGVVTPSDLYRRSLPLPVPNMVGGMATPFGVYLTNGSVSGGAKWWGLMAAGAVLSTMFLAADAITVGLMIALPMLQEDRWGVVVQILPVLLFLAGLRLAPVAGTHAAEHQVVHAMERGEPLLPEVVRRMPRVHPRCGTNLAAAAMLFLTTFSTPWHPDDEVRLLAALLVTVVLWRGFGTLLQTAVTTKPANARQIENGIRAARELLDNYSRSRRVPRNPLERLFHSGIFHVMAGGSIVAVVAHFANRFLNWPFGW